MYVQLTVIQHFLFFCSEYINVCEFVVMTFLSNIFVIISHVDQPVGSFWSPVLKFLQVTGALLSMEVAGCECL